MLNLLLAQSEIVQSEMPDSSSGAIGLIAVVIILAVFIFYAAVGWKVFTKAGQPGWAVLIPIYNVVVLLQIIGRPIWWIVLLMIPLVNIVPGFIVAIDLAKSFGKSAGFGVALIFLGFIFYPILGFGSAQYVGPAAAK